MRIGLDVSGGDFAPDATLKAYRYCFLSSMPLTSLFCLATKP